jgi:hypothetical protein
MHYQQRQTSNYLPQEMLKKVDPIHEDWDKLYCSIMELKGESEKSLQVSFHFFNNLISGSTTKNLEQAQSLFRRTEENKVFIKSSKSFIYNLRYTKEKESLLR